MQLIVKGILKIVVPLTLFGFVIVGLWNFDSILDWWKLLDYNPPAEISAMANKTTMTEPAKRLFYINHPTVLSNPKEFQKKCTVIEKTIVLGCYRQKQSGIYLYDIKDKRLDGIKEVTAAHEMLHAHYERLSKSDKKYVDGLLNDFYKNGLSDKRILDNIELYKKTEPNDIVNEMHSIFATEVMSLPKPLDDYYKNYFTDRLAVVKMAQSYESEFNSRSNQISQLDQQLKSLKSKIEQERSDVELKSTQLKDSKSRLDDYKNSGRINEYNAAVPGYNALVDSYNSLVNQLKTDIENYNKLIESYNQTAEELRGLYEAINANSIPQASN